MTGTLKENLQKTITRIRPSPSELQEADGLITRLRSLIMHYSTSYSVVDVVPCGSIAKGTSLRGDSDIDLFVRLSHSDGVGLDRFAKEVGGQLAHDLETDTQFPYADHPYVKLRLSGERYSFDVNIVPTIFVESKDRLAEALKISSLARTPLHTEYAREKLGGREDEARLMKYFAKKKQVYGLFGLTGWVCELLILCYGSFQRALEGLSNLGETPIALSPAYEPSMLQKRFPHDVVIVLDPVDDNRNAASGIQGFLGDCNLQRLRRESRFAKARPDYLFRKPKLRFNLQLKFSLLRADIPETNQASFLGGIVNYFARNLELYGYSVRDALCESLKHRISLRVRPLDQPFIQVYGPPKNLPDALDEFKAKHLGQRIYQKGSSCYIRQPSRVPSVEAAIKYIMPDLRGWYTLEAIQRLTKL